MNNGHQPREIAQAQRGHVAAAQVDAAARGLEVFRQQVEQRGLTRAVCPDERGDFSLRNGQVQAIEYGHAPVVVSELQPVYSEDGGSGHRIRQASAGLPLHLISRNARKRGDQLLVFIIRHRYHVPFGAAG